MNTLRFTETNSADDSTGRTWGLEGNLFWYLAGGGFVAVVIMLVLFSVFKLSLFVSLLVAAVPLALTLGYRSVRRLLRAGRDCPCRRQRLP